MSAMRKKTGQPSGEAKPRKKRIRRTPEQIINDLQEEIQRLRVKAQAKQLEKSPSMKATLSALKGIDKALDSAAREGDTALRHALADARKSIAGFLEKQGVQIPKANLPKGPRPKE